MRLLPVLSGLLLSSAIATCPQPLLDPLHCCTLTAPSAFKATFITSAGSFTLAITRAAAPLGVDRFYNLMYYGYFGNSTMGPGNAAGFFRVVPNFVVQFGIAGLPAVSAAWENANIKDDPVVMSNTVGTIAFATAGPDTRTTQVYINLGDNSRLDKDGFAPFGKVVEGMQVVTALYSGYGEQPDQDLIYSQGDAYLVRFFFRRNPPFQRICPPFLPTRTPPRHLARLQKKSFPQLDYTLTTKIE